MQTTVDALVDTVNRMLDQIGNLVEGVRNVSNSTAHDLRTPLSELRSRLEELSVTRPAPERAWAKLHGGRLELTDNEPGLKATLVLPG